MIVVRISPRGRLLKLSGGNARVDYDVDGRLRSVNGARVEYDLDGRVRSISVAEDVDIIVEETR